MSNAINPEHYNRLNPQPKDVIRAWGLNFNLGSAVKYISRAGHKDDIVQDLNHSLSGGYTVGRIVEIGLNSITVDSSSKHHSDVIPIEINDITDIKVMNRRA